MNRFVRNVTVIIAAVAVLGCTGKQEPSSPREGGRLVVGVLTEPETLNPLLATTAESQDIINMMFSKLLVERGDFLNFDPGLAQRWFIGSDSLSITFQLRRNAVWHDSVPVTAEDVRFTWQLHRDRNIAWPHRSVKDRIVDVEVVDDRTVTFRFSERYPYQLMDANDGVILPKHLLEDVPRGEMQTADYGRMPVGSGPFRLVRWEPGQFVELARNPLYYRAGRPYLERVVFRVVPDMTTLVTLLKAGEIDCLESLPPDVLRGLDDNPDIRVYHYLSRAATCIVWNTKNPLFAEPGVRRALGRGIDAAQIITVVWGGMARPLDSPMHPVLWAHRSPEATIAYDPQRARQELAAMGWIDTDGDGVIDRDGVAFEFEMLTNQGNQQRADIITMAQAYLREVGVRVKPRVLEGATFFEAITRGRFESCVLGWRVPTKADLTSFWGSAGFPPAGFNAARYANPEADSLMALAQRMLDPEEAADVWAECQQMIYDDQPVYFLAVPYETVGLSQRFCGVKPNAISFFANVDEWFVTTVCNP